MRIRSLRTAFVLSVATAVIAIPAAAVDGIDPPTTAVTIVPGGSQTLEQNLHLDALPAKADIVIAVDTTGSMGAAIADAKADATNIVTSVKTLIPGARFAVVDYKDYPIAPYGGLGDYPYLLRQTLTESKEQVQAAINAMTASGGGDFPESLNRVMSETANDTALLWDPAATRILIVLTDAIGHDPAQATTFPACANTTGIDLGRDGLPGGGDDIGTLQAINALKAKNTTLSVITYAANSAVGCLKALAEATGGSQVPRGESGRLLGLIEGIVTEQAKEIGSIDFRVAPSSYASWLTFTPPTPYGPFIAPRDIPYELTISVPDDAAVGSRTLTIKAIVDGTERATQTITVSVAEREISGLELSVDRGAVPAGISVFSPSVVPPERVPFFAGVSSASMPVGSVPVGSVPVGSVPVGSVPVGSVPVGSVPVGSVPVGSVGLLSLPVGSVPVGSVPVGSVPVGSVGLDRILLSSVPIDPASGTTWDAILAGTPLAGRPLQTLTLHDLSENETARNRFNALELRHLSFFSSLLRDVKLASILLGNATLSQLPVPAGHATWADAIEAAGGDATNLDPAKNTVLGVDIAGRLGSTPVGSVPVGSVPVGSVPVGSVPVGSVDLLRTRLADVPVNDLGTNRDLVVECTASPCDPGLTFGAAQTAGKIKSTATIEHLQPVLAATGVTVAELIAAFLGLANYPWQTIPLVGLQDVAGHSTLPRYTVDFTLDCGLASNVASVRATLPPGFLPKSKTARWSYGNVVAAPGPDAVASRGAFAFAPPASICGTSTLPRAVSLSFDTYAGVELGTHTAAATVTASNGASRTVADEAPIVVVQNHEPNAAAPQTTPLEKHKVMVFHVASSGDTETFTLPVPPRNSRTKIHLAVPDGVDLDLAVGKESSPGVNSSAPVGSVPVGSVPVGSVPLPDEGATKLDDARSPQPEPLQDIPVGSVPVGSVPVGSVPVGSVPLADEGASTNDADRSPQPETLQDIPVGSVPVGSVSATRGSADEAVELVSDGSGGSYTVTVSGYNGDFSPQAAVLYVTETAPPPLPDCAPRSFAHPTGTVGTLPTSVPAGTKTLFLVNREQMSRLHGSDAVSDLLAEITTGTAPAVPLASRPEVQGAVLELDGRQQVRDAYAAWNAAPCSIEAANEVVRAATAVVDDYLDDAPGLEYIVLLGSDEAIPSGRVPDPVLISPELDNAADLAFTTAGLTNGNALYASAATNHMLTDAVYGAFTTIPWRGRQLNLPQVAVSRLLESPAEIEGQLLQYQVANGQLSPSTAYVTGYDFLTDGAEAIRDALNRPGSITPVLQTAPTWTKSTIETEFFNAGTPAAIASLNAHYNHYLAQPAAATTAADLFSTSIVQGNLLDRILFSMGCHGGLNVADSLFASGAPAAALDWAQRYAQAKVAVYVANYTFGYGDTKAVALSERLMALFADRLGRDNRSLAAQWVDSLHTYFATVGTAYGDYDEKALIGANLMGPPWYRVAGAPEAAVPDPTPIESRDGMTVAPVTASFAGAAAPTMVGDGPSGGPTYWKGESTLAVHYRPLQPVSSFRINPPAGTPPARGIFINALTTHDVAGIKPLLAHPTVDLGEHEPKANFDEAFFPANYVLLSRTGRQTRAIVSTGQFRPTEGSDRGTQRLVDAISFEVAFSEGADDSAPRISRVGAVETSPTSARIFVEARDAENPIRRVAALVNDGSSSWRLVSLAPVGGALYAADVTGLATTDVEIAAQVQDTSGNVGYSTKKGENFNTIVDTGGPDVLVDKPLPGDVYILNEVVTPRIACSDAGGVGDCTPPPVDTSTVGPHTYSVVSTDLGGATTTSEIDYAVHYVFTGFLSPVDKTKVNQAKAGSTIPLKWQLQDVAGAYQRDLNSVTSLTSRKEKCANAAIEPLPDTVTEDVAGLRYTDEQFQFNWKSQKIWAGTCRTFYVALADGTVHQASFSFK